NSIGGYPSFTQTDPRIRMPEFKDDQLLFQLSSTDYGNDVQVIWGDSGIGNFFIHPTDLVNQDFSKTWYNWDCY
ncbi:MAG: YwqG family protein, partial [Carnobacterium sp.]